MTSDDVCEWIYKSWRIVMRDEPCYRFGSVDNVRIYAAEHIVGDGEHLSSVHGLCCSDVNGAEHSVVLGAHGGATCIHQHSCLILNGRCFVAVGSFLVCLALPALRVVWAEATCFGVHALAEPTSLVSHGEIEIARLSLEGDVLWSAAGADIFSEPIQVVGDVVMATDFNGRRYRFALGEKQGRS